MNADEIVNAISERVRETANVSVVFGEPRELSGVTIIPVAKVKVGGGGGGGRGKAKRRAAVEESAAPPDEGGMGLGMQIVTVPLGYIEIKDGEARFVNIVDATKVLVGGMIVTGLALLLGVKARSRRMAWKKMKMHKHHHAT